MRSSPPSNSAAESIEHAPKGRELLWQLWHLITERCLSEIQKPKCAPAWVAIAVAWCKWNDVKSTKGARSAVDGLRSLRDAAGDLSAPFGVVRGDRGDKGKP